MPLDRAVWSFGDEVGRIVEGCTDADTHPKPPWLERKQAYIDRLAEEDRSVLLVSASDKLHNARSIVRDLREVGDTVWDRFSATKDQTLWYYRSLVTGYRSNPAHTPALIDELDRTVAEMERLAGARRLKGPANWRCVRGSGAGCSSRPRTHGSPRLNPASTRAAPSSEIGK